MRVAIYGKRIKTKGELNEFKEILNTVREFGWTAVVSEELQFDLAKYNYPIGDLEIFTSYRDFRSGIDCVLSAGGDGTMIKTISFVRDSNVPIIGVNLGRLGFLANIHRTKVREAFQQLENKQFSYQKRTLISTETEKDLFGDANFAINEVTVHRKDIASMIEIYAEIEGEYLNNYWADGLIIATPSGSTAYNLSCGGPIVEPNCNVHIITPISAHNMNVRPMIVSNDLLVKLRVSGRAKEYLLSLDSRTKSVQKGEEIRIKKADFTIRTITFENSTFLETIRHKMLWGLDKRN